MNTNWMAKLEYKFGKYAIRNLTTILIGCYVVGYVIELLDAYVWKIDLTEWLTLNPYAIVHGQVWRIISWILIPPSQGTGASGIFFTIIMIMFYFSIGRTLENTWGDFQYNLYLFSGMIFTLLGSFVTMAISYIFNYSVVKGYGDYYFFEVISYYFSTYYVNMSIFLAYAATFPDNRVLLMFFIPIRVKILGFIYAGFMIYDMASLMITFYRSGATFLMYVPPIVLAASLLNFLLFFLLTRNYIRMNHAQRQAHRAYARQARQFKRKEQNPGFTKHRCAVCGRTEKDGDNLVFRYCSKCEGNMEYCQDHLYTHVHYVQPRP